MLSCANTQTPTNCIKAFCKSILFFSFSRICAALKHHNTRSECHEQVRLKHFKKKKKTPFKVMPVIDFPRKHKIERRRRALECRRSLEWPRRWRSRCIQELSVKSDVPMWARRTVWLCCNESARRREQRLKLKLELDFFFVLQQSIFLPSWNYNPGLRQRNPQVSLQQLHRQFHFHTCIICKLGWSPSQCKVASFFHSTTFTTNC